jgi:hypothetical protein
MRLLERLTETARPSHGARESSPLQAGGGVATGAFLFASLGHHLAAPRKSVSARSTR